MKVISVGKNDIGRRIDNFLFALFCKIPKTLIYKLIRKKKIKVNSKKVNENYRLKENDVINLYLNDEILESKACKDDFLSAPSDIDVIYEDKNILLINKKIGLVCQPDNKNIVDKKEQSSSQPGLNNVSDGINNTVKIKQSVTSFGNK